MPDSPEDRGHLGGPPWMRGRPPWGSGPPPWWPAGESWPPEPGAWTGMRRHVLRRFLGFALVAFLLFTAAITLVVSLTWHAARRGPAVIGLLLLVLAAIVVARGARRLVGPIGDLLGAAGHVAEGDYTVKVPERGSPEVRRLARAFNSMTSRLAEADGRRRDLLADVTHELRTPLAVIRGNVEAVVDGIYPSDAAHLQPVLDEIDLMQRLLEDLQTVSTAEAGALKLRREPIEPAELVKDAVATFQATAREAGVRLEGHADEGLPALSLDRLRVDEIFSNLVSNSLRHTPRDGSIRVSAKRVADGIEFVIEDSGEGISPEDLPHVFERFAKSPTSKGSGLGLAIARGLVEAHGGTISAESAPALGTIVRLVLPVQ
jgi:two-component system sensor histidine kinase BaeS